MATAAEILAKAQSYVGTKESPANSNNVIFNTDYYGGAVSGSAYPWCCAFVWDIFRMVGASDLFYGGQKTAYCPTALNWYKQQGRFYTVSQGGQVGDVVFFSWANNGVADHIGFVKSRNSDGSYQTIEGNTSVTSNDNGGAVMERTRTTTYILGFGRPAYQETTTIIEEDEEMNQEQFNSMMDNYLAARNVDNTVSDWAKTAWANMTAASIMDGTMPQGFVTREQLATILNKQGVNAFKLYANVCDCPDWMQSQVQTMIDAGFISGDGVNTVGKTHLQLEVMIVAYKMYLDAVARIGGAK